MLDFLTVTSASGVSVKPEHIAVHCYNGVQTEVENLVSKKGFVCLSNSGTTAFLKRRGQQIELIAPSGAPEHVAWLVSNTDDFATLHEAFAMVGCDSFKLLEEHNINREDLKAMMFRHEDGAVIQIVWRKILIFTSSE